MIRDVITSYLDAVRRCGRTSTRVADFAAPFPVEVISTMLGVPKEDRQQIRHLDRPHAAPRARRPEADAARAWRRALQQVGYFLELIADKRATRRTT